jgi:hypothetical protein
MNDDPPAIELTPALEEAAARGFLDLCNYLWAEKYVPTLEAKVREEEAMRSDPFAEGVDFEVCGEPLRLMTPRDLVLLDGFESPYVSGGDPDEADAAFFLWTLHARNAGGMIRTAWERGRFNGRFAARIETLGFADADEEILAYMRRVLYDLPKIDPKVPLHKRAPSINAVAGLLVDVACLVGPTDPYSGSLLADSPIPRLIQYRRTRENAKGGGAYGEIDSAKVHCQDEANAVMAAIRAKPKA